MHWGFDNINATWFTEFGLVTSGSKIPRIISDRLGQPFEVFREGKFERGHYKDVPFEIFRELATANPKVVRYVYCIKT